MAFITKKRTHSSKRQRGPPISIAKPENEETGTKALEKRGGGVEERKARRNGGKKSGQEEVLAYCKGPRK